MSFQTFWGNFTSEFTETLREEIAAQIQANPKRPSFLGEIKLLALDFGNVSPEIELTDLVDPFPEFYRFEDTEHHGESRDHYAHGHNFSPNPIYLQDIGEEHSSITNVDHYDENYSAYPPVSPHSINPNELASSLRDLASNSRNPAWEGDLDVDSDQNSDELASGAYFAYATGNHHLQRNHSNMFSFPPSPPSLNNNAHQNLHNKHDEDIQAHLKILYDGDMSLTISTSLNIDYPTKNFMSLPIVLKVTGFSLEVNAVVAILQSKIRFSLLPLEDPNAQILSALRVESIIGEVHRHTLRNVDRVESFILDKVRRIVSDKLVFPNFITHHRKQGNSES